jgi:GxxExxY protein
MSEGLHASLTKRIVRCGPGLLESVYESALCIELTSENLAFKRQIGIPLYYKGSLLSEHRPDLVICDAVIVEVKAIEHFERVHTAQLLTYLRITGLRVGLMLNFNTAVLKDGIRRFVL